MALNLCKIDKNEYKLRKIPFFHNLWLKFEPFLYLMKLKWIIICRNGSAFIKSPIFYNYKSLFCSKIMKKYEKLTKMVKNGIFGHF